MCTDSIDSCTTALLNKLTYGSSFMSLRHILSHTHTHTHTLTHLTEAEPTESEEDVHTKVASVLLKAREVLDELRSYKGAGVEIREVASHTQTHTHTHTK